MNFPLDMLEKSAILKAVDVNVASDQPPSTPNIVACSAVRRGSSGSVSLFGVLAPPLLALAQVSSSRSQRLYVGLLL